MMSFNADGTVKNDYSGGKTGAQIAAEIFGEFELRVGNRVVKLKDMTEADKAQYDAEYWERERAIADAEEQASRIAREKKSGTCSLRSFRSEGAPVLQKALIIAKDFCGQKGMRAVALFGKTGTGKTHLLKGIALETHGMYVDMFTLLNEVAASRSYSAKVTESELFKKYKFAEMLCIDNVGYTKRPQDEIEVLHRIIEARTDYDMPYALATQMMPDQLKMFVDESTRSRMKQYCKAIDMSSAGDYRDRPRP